MAKSVERDPDETTEEQDATSAAVLERQRALARHRSPNYPFISLERAIEQTRAIYGTDRLRDIPLRVACQRWEFKLGGSQADQTVAALKAFGMIEVTGSRGERNLRISERAYRILAGARDAMEQIKQAAIAPAIYSELWKTFGVNGRLPENDVIRNYLLFDRENGRFNSEAVETLIVRFRETISFARLDSSDKIAVVGSQNVKPLAIGDYVQWESAGVAQFTEPRRVTGKSDDGAFVFVDGQPCGLPTGEIHSVNEIIAAGKKIPVNAFIQPPAPSGPSGPTGPTGPSGPSDVFPPTNPNYRPPSSDTKQFSLTTDTGDVMVRWPAVLSEEDFKTIDGWLDGIKKKISRSVKSAADDTSN